MIGEITTEIIFAISVQDMLSIFSLSQEVAMSSISIQKISTTTSTTTAVITHTKAVFT